MSDYLHKCLFCKNYNDGRCVRLTKDIDGFDVAEDVFYTEAELMLKLNEHLTSSGSLEADINRVLNTCTLIGKKKLASIQSEIGRLLVMYRNKWIEEAEELFSDELFGLHNDSDYISHIGVAVEPDFYCKYWE